MKESYEIKLRCAICGSEDQFEFNEERTFIKCSFCNREYLGGIEELKEFNQDVFDEVEDEIKNDAASYTKEELTKDFSGCKSIKLK